MAVEVKNIKEKTKIDLRAFAEDLGTLDKHSVKNLFCHAARYNMPDILDVIWKVSHSLFSTSGSGENRPLYLELNSPDIYNVTALDYAIDAKHINIVRQLLTLDKTVNLNRKAKNGKTLLENAISSGSLEMVKCLITEFKVSFDEKALEQALASEKLDIAWFFICKLKYTKQQLCEVLSLAAKQNQTAILKSAITQILQKSKTPLELFKQFNKQGHTILGVAVKYRSFEAVKILIELGNFDVNIADRHGMSPMHYVASVGDLEIAKFLIKHNASIENTSYNGQTPLFVAIVHNEFRMVKLLISQKSDVNKNVNGETPLSLSLKQGFFEIAFYLFKNGAVASNKQIFEMLCLATKNNKLEHIEELLKLCADNLGNPSQFNGHTLLMIAARAGNATLVKLLLDAKKTDVNFCPEVKLEDLKLESILQYKEVTDLMNPALDVKNRYDKLLSMSSGALHEAAFSGNIQIAELLLKAGAIINATNICKITPLQVASAKGHLEMVRFLLENKASIEHKTSLVTAITLALQFKKIEVVKLLLERGATILDFSELLHLALNEEYLDVAIIVYNEDKEKLTKDNIVDLLCLAAKHNRPSLIRQILGNKKMNGDLVNALSTQGFSALSLAVRYGHQNIVQLLLKYKADSNQINRDGTSPLHIAVLANQYDIARVLFAAGAGIEHQLPNGKTPLCIAAEYGLITMVELLLNKGAKINHKAKQSGTPLFLASENDHILVVKLLLKRNADPSIKGIIKKTTSPMEPLICGFGSRNAKLTKMLTSPRAPHSIQSMTKHLSIRDKLTPSFRTIPKHIYFAWVGGPIPKLEYFATVVQLAALAKKSGFTINLVVDNIIDYHKASALFDIKIPNLIICPVHMYLKKMKDDVYYKQNEKYLKQFQNCVLREAVGFKNLAALVDFVRLEALRQTGGHYFDIDTKFKIGAHERLHSQHTGEGILLHCKDIEKNVTDETNTVRKAIASMMSNDIIGSVADHEALSSGLIMMYKKYKKLDQTRWKNNGYDLTLQDKKRYLFIPRDGSLSVQTKEPGSKYLLQEGSEDRRSLTLDSSCYPIKYATSEYLNKTALRFSGSDITATPAMKAVCYPNIEDNMNCSENPFNETGCQVSGILAQHRADQNWLKTSVPGKKTYAFDDSELYTASVRSHLGRKKS